MYEMAKKDHFILEITDETGSGSMEAFQVFPGIFLMFNTFHLEKCRTGFSPPETFWGVEHCRSGKTEWQVENGDYAYLGSGALMPCDYRDSAGEFSFPGGFYEGLSLGLDMAGASAPAMLALNLEELRSKILSAGLMDISGDPQAEAILRLLYQSRFQTDLHRKLAVMEFLNFLKDLEPTSLELLYIRRQTVEEIKRIEAFLREHLEHRWTLQELSERFQMPVSVLRRNFSGIYGLSVADHMRRLRIERAKLLLLETEKTIGEIASELGYDNASKFSAAFRGLTDLSPRSYRSQNR